MAVTFVWLWALVATGAATHGGARSSALCGAARGAQRALTMSASIDSQPKVAGLVAALEASGRAPTGFVDVVKVRARVARPDRAPGPRRRARLATCVAGGWMRLARAWPRCRPAARARGSARLAAASGRGRRASRPRRAVRGALGTRPLGARAAVEHAHCLVSRVCARAPVCSRARSASRPLARSLRACAPAASSRARVRALAPVRARGLPSRCRPPPSAQGLQGQYASCADAAALAPALADDYLATYIKLAIDQVRDAGDGCDRCDRCGRCDGVLAAVCRGGGCAACASGTREGTGRKRRESDDGAGAGQRAARSPPWPLCPCPCLALSRTPLLCFAWRRV
jgi:hypothetical protein